jgi:hypothetical protein
LWGQKAQKQPEGTIRTNLTFGEKFVYNRLNLIGLKLGESVRGSRKRKCPRQQINVVIHKTFKREYLRQFCRKDFSQVFDDFQMQAFKLFSESFIQLWASVPSRKRA